MMRISWGKALIFLAATCLSVFSSGMIRDVQAAIESYKIRKQRVIDLLASEPIPEPVDKWGYGTYENEAKRALARLVKGVDLDAANDYFGKWGPTHDVTQYNDDFTYTYWIRAYFLFKDTDRLTPAAKSRMLKKIGEWRDRTPSGSENHSIVQASNIYSFGAHYIFFGNYVVPVTKKILRSALHAALSDYRPPQVIVDIAIDKAGKGTYVLKARRPRGNIYYYVTPEFVLACAQNGGSLGKIGIGGVEKIRYGDQRWDLSFGTDPRAVIHSNGEGRPSQYKNLLVINTEGKPLIYAPLLGRDFEIREVDGDWTFIKEGGTHAAIRTVEDSLYLLEVRLASDYSSFTHFKNDIKDNPLSRSGSCYTYTSTKGDVIEFTDHIIKVNGRRYDTSNYKLFDSPFVNSERDSGYVIIRKGNQELILDFRDPANPKRIIRIVNR